MKKKIYTSPICFTTYFQIEESIATGSAVDFGGNTNGQPNIEDQPVEEEEWEIIF